MQYNMNYQHGYHAGNHADIFKQLVLCSLIDYLNKKPSPFCYIDTHAGSGQYDLRNIQRLHPEWQTGFGKLLGKNIIQPIPTDSASVILQNYCLFIQRQSLSCFPGSPMMVNHLLRPQDAMIVIEKNLQAYKNLKKLFIHHPQVQVHHSDAYAVLTGFLPPPMKNIKRALVFIDPPYEQKNEFDLLIVLLQKALQRCQTASYVVWYPIKSRDSVRCFYQKISLCIKQKLAKDIVILECCPWPDDIAIRLNGSGMLVINPPFKFEQTISAILKTLILLLKQHPKAFFVVKKI